MKRILFRIFIGLLIAGALLAVWIAYDLYAPHKVDIRDFDADEVARLDTAMWRSYYSREACGFTVNRRSFWRSNTN